MSGTGDVIPNPLAARSPVAGAGVSVTVELEGYGSATGYETGNGKPPRLEDRSLGLERLPEKRRIEAAAEGSQRRSDNNDSPSCRSCCTGFAALIGVLVLAAAVAGIVLAGESAAEQKSAQVAENSTLPSHPSMPATMARSTVTTPTPTATEPEAGPTSRAVELMEPPQFDAADTQATDTLQGRVPLDAQLEAAGLQALARLRGAQPLPPMRALRVLATVLLRLAGRGSASLDAAALEAVRVLPEAMCLPAAQPAPSNVSTFARALPVDAQQPGSSAGDETGQLCDHPAITWLGDALQQRLKVANSTALPTVVNHASAANHSQITPSARRLAFSPDGSRLAFAIDRGVQMWHVAPGGMALADGGRLYPLCCNASPTWLSWSPSLGAPSGAGLAIGASDGGVYLLWVGAGAAPGPWRLLDDGIAGAWSPDGSRLAVAKSMEAPGPAVEVIEASSLLPPRRLHLLFSQTAGSPRVLALSWSRAGQLATSTVDGRLALWQLLGEIPTGVTALHEHGHAQWLVGHSGALPLLSWSPNGQLAAANANGAWLWMATGREEWPSPALPLLDVSQHRIGSATSLQWSRFGDLAAGDVAGTVHIWQQGAGLASSQLMEGHTRPVTTLAWGPMQGSLASSGEEGDYPHVWHETANGGQLADAAEVLVGRASALDWHPRGKRLAVAGYPGAGSGPDDAADVRIWAVGLTHVQELFKRSLASLNTSLASVGIDDQRDLAQELLSMSQP